VEGVGGHPARGGRARFGVQVEADGGGHAAPVVAFAGLADQAGGIGAILGLINLLALGGEGGEQALGLALDADVGGDFAPVGPTPRDGDEDVFTPLEQLVQLLGSVAVIGPGGFDVIDGGLKLFAGLVVFRQRDAAEVIAGGALGS